MEEMFVELRQQYSCIYEEGLVVGDMTKILYHDMTKLISRYSDIFLLLKRFLYYIKIFDTTEFS